MGRAGFRVQATGHLDLKTQGHLSFRHVPRQHLPTLWQVHQPEGERAATPVLQSHLAVFLSTSHPEEPDIPTYPQSPASTEDVTSCQVPECHSGLCHPRFLKDVPSSCHLSKALQGSWWQSPLETFKFWEQQPLTEEPQGWPHSLLLGTLWGWQPSSVSCAQTTVRLWQLWVSSATFTTSKEILWPSDHSIL